MDAKDLILNASETAVYEGALEPAYGQLRLLAQRQSKSYGCPIRVVAEDGRQLEIVATYEIP